MEPQQLNCWYFSTKPVELIRLSEALLPKRLRLRKWRLYAVHCCQVIYPLLTRDAVRQALQTAEAYADGLASPEQLREGWLAVRQALNSTPLRSRWESALTAVLHATTVELRSWDVEHLSFVIEETLRGEGIVPLKASPQSSQRELLAERQRECAILRDLFNPVLPPIDPSWLLWEDGQIPQLAQAIYQEGRFEAMPVLADALEEAGCDEQALLDHARLPAEHFKGCWLLDALRSGLSRPNCLPDYDD
jgi:hypothetical protein